MRYLLLILLLFPFLLSAQEKNNNYLAGAVPVVDGRVIFSRTINAPALSQDQIYTSVLEWAEKRFVTDKEQKGRIVYKNQEKGEIACWGEENLTFARTALSLDRSLINYRLILVCSAGKCEAQVSAIRYSYNVATKKEPEKYTAEEQITDEYALNKNKDKLAYNTGKFRSGTIDLTEDLFAGIQTAMGANIVSQTPPPPTVFTSQSQTTPANATAAIPANTTITPAPLQGFKQIAPENIPGNIIKMLSNDWMLITAGKEDFNMMTASWGGLGYLYNKPVAFCFIAPTRHTYQLMEKGDTYTLTFYTETYRDALQFCGSHSGKDTDKVKATGLSPVMTPSGSRAFSEAWMIIECRKLISQSITPEAIFNEKLKEEWTGKQLHKMYIGEIINVWVK